MESSYTFGMISGCPPLPHIRSSPPPRNTVKYPMVFAFVDQDTRWWKIDTFRATFIPFEVKTILKIPLSFNQPDDSIIWLDNKKGEFTVKSAYHIATKLIDNLEEGESSSGDPRVPLWRNLWCLKLAFKAPYKNKNLRLESLCQ